MSGSRLKIGMAQMLVEGAAVQENLRRATEMIRAAAQEGCQIVVLPECLDIGWTHPAARQLAQPIPGIHSNTLAQAAVDAEIHVVAGLTETDGTRIYNAAVLISPEGLLLLKHRKINELDIAWDLYARGDCLRVAETDIGRIGVTICADNFPESLDLGRALGRMGAQALLSPCAWAVDADHENEKQPYGGLWREAYSALTLAYPLTVAGVSNVGWLSDGPWKGRKCIGCSMAYGPGARLLAQGPYGDAAEELIAVETELV